MAKKPPPPRASRAAKRPRSIQRPRPDAPAKLREMDAEEFARRLADNDGERRFALFLGAGCSVSSGIPAAGELVRGRWLPKLRDLEAPSQQDLDAWARTRFSAYDPTRAAALYGELIERLFVTPRERQQEIEALCDGRTPSFGYAVLAQLVAEKTERFNVVLTTNFDDLVADALYLYTDRRPLVIQHESLAAFIRPTRTRPLIVKLHGDHRLSPRNTALETKELEAEIRSHTAMVLNDRGLVFLGYGGADQGIHKLLDELPPDAVPFGAYWVHPEPPSGPIATWLVRRGGVWVRSGWFDDVMLLLRKAFDLAHPTRERFDRIFDLYHRKFEELSQAAAKPGSTATPAVQAAIAATEQSLPDDWQALLEGLRLERVDPNRADEHYRAALKRHPRIPALLGNYALFLNDVRKDHDAAEALYKRAIEADPNRANSLGNYANFLTDVRKDHDAAEALYKRAIEADPNNANNLGNYAVFLTDVRKDHDAAEALYKRAIEADPKQTYNRSNYAAFLTDVRKDHDAAEALYKRAIEADPNDADSLGNYAAFLTSVRKVHDAAEVLFKRAIEADPNNANNLGNYGGFLLSLDRPAGLDLVARALEHSGPEDDALRVECEFYRFANGPVEVRGDALRRLKQLLAAGARSPGWDLSANVAAAERAAHRDAAWLHRLAAVVSDGADLETLADWPAWAATP